MHASLVALDSPAQQDPQMPMHARRWMLVQLAQCTTAQEATLHSPCQTVSANPDTGLAPVPVHATFAQQTPSPTATTWRTASHVPLDSQVALVLKVRRIAALWHMSAPLVSTHLRMLFQSRSAVATVDLVVSGLLVGLLLFATTLQQLSRQVDYGANMSVCVCAGYTSRRLLQFTIDNTGSSIGCTCNLLCCGSRAATTGTAIMYDRLHKQCLPSSLLKAMTLCVAVSVDRRQQA